jgi:lipoate-protein ligase A
MSPVEGRLIPLDAGGSAENMAIDQALLESVDDSRQPVLRLYTWSQPTLSLGYFQAVEARRDHAESSQLLCVRRSTGGGAIVHHHELTYSVVVPSAGRLAGPRIELYEQTHAAVAAALSPFRVRAVPRRMLSRETTPTSSKHPFLCFQRCSNEDLVVSGYKVLGSAQRKSRHAVLQHGSLLLGTSPWAPQLPGVRELTSQSVPLRPLAECFAAVLSDVLSIRWRIDEISGDERSRAGQIVVQKFGSDRWLLRR